ncbi:hypothetical protein [Clostridium sp.]|uniref:hypothetical protein n=1 Tax=Clostridium sp. TaxID=1506 RepID=UPI003994B7A9
MAIKKENIKVRGIVSRELNQKFLKFAKSQNTSASKIIKELIIEYVENNKKISKEEGND